MEPCQCNLVFGGSQCSNEADGKPDGLCTVCRVAHPDWKGPEDDA